MQTKGLLIDIYRASNRQDCTNGGVSSQHDRVVMVSDDYKVPEIFETEGRGVLKMVRRNVGFAEFPILVPLDAGKNGDPYMFGGNFGYTSDSRYLPGAPMQIFDRKE